MHLFDLDNSACTFWMFCWPILSKLNILTQVQPFHVYTKTYTKNFNKS